METKHLVVKAGISQRAIARLLGVSDAAVSKWLAGRIPVDRVASVAAVTGIPAAELRPDLAATFAQMEDHPNAKI